MKKIAKTTLLCVAVPMEVHAKFKAMALSRGLRCSTAVREALVKDGYEMVARPR
jgi:hypothetical protein